VELIDSKTGLHNRESAGGLINDLDCLAATPARRTCRAISHVSALRIASEIWSEFLRRAGLVDSLRQVLDNRQILQSTWLFGEMVSFPLQIRIAHAMEKRIVREDDVIAPQGKAEIVLLAEGLASVFLGARSIENLKPGGFFCEETVMRGARELPAGWRQRFIRPSIPGRKGSTGTHLFEARALLESTLYAIPAEVIEDIPVVQWKLMETFERRLKGFRAEIRFVWHDSYAVGLPEIDEQHRELFVMIDGLTAVADGQVSSNGMMDAVSALISRARAHLLYEESLASRNAGPEYDAAVEGHGDFLKKAEGLSRYLETAPVDALHTMVEFFKDWIIDHTLIEDRRFKDALGG
jgi:hemerythrin